jgi:hypothetical protein
MVNEHNLFNSNSCVICEYSITDPICRDCYIKQTTILLNDLKINHMINNIISNKIKKVFSLETINNTKCILCKENNVTMCRYCFSVILIRILRELNLTEDLIENFEYKPIYEEVSLKN